MGNDMSSALPVPTLFGEIMKASAGGRGDDLLDIAVRGGSLFFGTTAGLTGAGVPAKYALFAAGVITVIVVTVELIQWWERMKRIQEIPQGFRIDGNLEERCPLHETKVCRRSKEPYEFKFSKPGYTFTGIASVPLSKEIPSPDPDFIEGGVNHSYVTVRLTPVEEGNWACRILICGKPCTTGPSAEESKQGTGRADTCGSERSRRTIPQCRLVEGTPEERDALQQKTVFLQSQKPYDYIYSKPGYTFTGIACLPEGGEIQSPEAEVIKGGINCSTVTVRLTPVQEGESACRIMVCGKPCTPGPSAELSEQTRRDGAFRSAASARAAAVSASALPAAAVYVVLVLLICPVVFEWCLRNLT